MSARPWLTLAVTILLLAALVPAADGAKPSGSSPVIAERSPTGDVSVPAGEPATFLVTVTDADCGLFSLTWAVDGITVQTDALSGCNAIRTFESSFAAGDHTVTATVFDERDHRRFSDTTTWRVSTAQETGPCADGFAKWGQTWHVRQAATRQGPQANLWDPAAVTCHGDGTVHLTTTFDGANWQAAELFTRDTLGFGTYTFDVEIPTGGIDANVVLGLFQYPGWELDGLHEIDIEHAKWGDPAAPGTQYVVWATDSAAPRPDACAGTGTWWGSPLCVKTFNPTDTTRLTHRFTRTADAVTFETRLGPAADNGLRVASWTYAPSDPATYVSSLAMPVHLNLWLLENGGHTPTTGEAVEVIVHEFGFEPDGGKVKPGKGRK